MSTLKRSGIKLIQPSYFPYDCIGIVESTFQIQNVYKAIGRGSGFLISDRLVLTCAHNIYQKRFNLFSSSIRFILVNDDKHFIYKVQKIWVPSSYTKELRMIDDYALLLLERPAYLPKYLELAYDYTEKQMVEVSGFHNKNMENTLNQYSDCQTIFKIEEGIIFHRASTQAGQSGSPIFVQLSKREIFVIGIHSFGRNIGEDNCNTGVLLTNNHVRMIKKWQKILMGRKTIKSISFSAIKSAQLPQISQSVIISESKSLENCIGIVQSSFKYHTRQTSGFLISDKLILTCAHSIFDIKHDEVASQIKFVHIEKKHIGWYKIQQLAFSKQYRKQNENYRKYDYALLLLKQPISLKKYYSLAFNYREAELAAISMLNLKKIVIKTWSIKIEQNRYLNLKDQKKLLDGSPIVAFKNKTQQMVVGIYRKNITEDPNELTKLFTCQTMKIIKMLETEIMGYSQINFINGDDLQSSIFCKQMKEKAPSEAQEQIQQAVVCQKYVRNFEQKLLLLKSSEHDTQNYQQQIKKRAPLATSEQIKQKISRSQLFSILVKNTSLYTINERDVQIYYTLGKAFISMHKLDQAKYTLRKSNYLLRKTKAYHISLKGLIFYQLGLVQKKLENYDQSIKHFNFAQGILCLNYQQNKLTLAKAYSHLGKIHRIRVSFENAMTCYKKAHDIQREEFGEDSTRVAQNLFELTECSTWFYQFSDAIQYAQKCLRSLKDRKTQQEEALYARCQSVLDLLIKIHLKLHQLSSEQLQKSIDLQILKERKQALREYSKSQERFILLIRLAEAYLPNQTHTISLLKQLL